MKICGWVKHPGGHTGPVEEAITPGQKGAKAAAPSGVGRAGAGPVPLATVQALAASFSSLEAQETSCQ